MNTRMWELQMELSGENRIPVGKAVENFYVSNDIRFSHLRNGPQRAPGSLIARSLPIMAAMVLSAEQLPRLRINRNALAVRPVVL